MAMVICLKILYLIGALLSFADPFTDGLTSWKYFEAGEYLWFALCLVFIIIPSIVYMIFWLCILPSDDDSTSGKMFSKLRCCFATMCCPFLPCCGKLYVAMTTKKHEDHELYIEVFNCLEVGIELAPQFILQFYAAMVQTRDISVIQIVSLTITFLRIGWCYAHINEDCTFKLCFGGLISVAARVFAYSLFAVALGAWVVLVIALHMLLTAVIQRSHRVRAFGYVCLSWLSYTPLGKDKESEEERLKWTSRTFIQPLLHVFEDILMAVLYYFFVDGGRTYPHRLKIMFGLIGGSVFGYIVLRLSKLAKCQSEQTADADIEACRQSLNEEEIKEVKKSNQKKMAEGQEATDGRTSRSFPRFSKLREWNFRRSDEVGKTGDVKREGDVAIGVEGSRQRDLNKDETVESERRGVFVGFSKLRNWRPGGQQQSEEQGGKRQQNTKEGSVDESKSSNFAGFSKIRDWKNRREQKSTDKKS